MPAPIVDILMYHAISDALGPTSIAPATFAAQIAAIAQAQVPVITLDDLVAARNGRKALAAYSIILTFDDGFQDFADVAWPILQPYGFRPIIYLPTSFVGDRERWSGGHPDPRPIMGWPTIRALAGQGVLFGSHSVSHPDLNALAADVLEAELIASKSKIEALLDRRIPHFAPPYGAADLRVRQRIAAHYATSVGTLLYRAGTDSDPHNLPRLEMFYFTDPARWDRHLAGHGNGYLMARRFLRRVRQALVA